MSRPDLSADQFWQFSCRCYGHKDIAAHALALQDSHNVNVNMLLFLCWCLESGVVLNLAQFSQLKQAIADSETMLAEHRSRRRQAHPDNGGEHESYAALKAQELDLERQQQAALVVQFNRLDSITRLPAKPGSAVLNASMAAFIHCYQLKDDVAARRHISVIVNQLSGL